MYMHECTSSIPTWSVACVTSQILDMETYSHLYPESCDKIHQAFSLHFLHIASNQKLELQCTTPRSHNAQTQFYSPKSVPWCWPWRWDQPCHQGGPGTLCHWQHQHCSQGLSHLPHPASPGRNSKLITVLVGLPRMLNFTLMRWLDRVSHDHVCQQSIVSCIVISQKWVHETLHAHNGNVQPWSTLMSVTICLLQMFQYTQHMYVEYIRMSNTQGQEEQCYRCGKRGHLAVTHGIE